MLQSSDDMSEMFRRMLRIRLFDEKALELRANGFLPGPMHTSIGQEATVVGACMALNDSDYMTGNHRSHGHPIGKGANMGPLMAELLGRATGVCGGKGGSQHLADFAVGCLGESGIVGAGMPIAVGAGLSARLRKTEQVCLSFFGDGAANSGPFHESHNLAAIWKLPVIFLCENNGYAVTTSAGYACSVPNVATRALAYGIPGETIDGQDVLAVYEAVARAVARARAGEGPSLVEAKTYRYREHAEFGAMAGSVAPYRTADEIVEWRTRDPLAAFRARLINMEVLTAGDADAVEAAIQEEVDRAASFALESPFPDLAEARAGLYVSAIPTRH